MTTGPYMNPDGEDAWLRLKQHLKWCDHFALGFIFTDHSKVVHVFRERLAGIYRARVTRLKTPVPNRPSDLFNKLLPDLIHPSVHQQALQAPCWIDLSMQQGDEWTRARLAFLARLNEQREPMRRALNRPLVLLLPIAERTRIKELVPDLWAIRDFSLVTDSWLKPKPACPTAPAQKTTASFPLTDYEHSLIMEWERLQTKKTLDRGFLLAADRALHVSLRTGRYSLASRIASSQEQTARKRLHASGETPEALRDLSVSLDNVGNTAKAMGQWDKAGKNFKEGLAIGVLLSESLPENVDYKGLANHFQNRLKELEKKG
ncbi:MAG: hypothetical protein U9N60_11435 [Thermodesulfobacteriota bacterium]|nr:hypothetical protein [Thermodesulfobacteriota bacterium]